MDPDEAHEDRRALDVYLDASRPRSEREAAFRGLVDRHARRLHAVCVRVLGSHADAEEVVQETFVRLARSGEHFRGEAALSTWLYRVARNLCIDRVRYDARRPQTPVAEVPDVVDLAATDGDARLQARAEADAVGRALAAIDEDSRRLLLLVAVDGLSYAEAAAATGVAVGTVKSRVSRARVRLVRLLADPADTSPDGDAPPDEPRPDPDAGRPRSARGPP